jgi:hypothetical protein
MAAKPRRLLPEALVLACLVAVLRPLVVVAAVLRWFCWFEIIVVGFESEYVSYVELVKRAKSGIHQGGTLMGLNVITATTIRL